ncbi:NAD(P)-dependent dehydrogenase (short-subunit alcohol dehydrogenase family) [Saccharopolyspora lacisalsi]|uniref:NAD(P)-dependent dehydrogenase (Short-subunit alcohol dehydrogenase family) n=1 Tax=Halosaccharopolyspora lacisalsi TaxID=1000566 RepID=A0A839DWF6_9PSEU|nr:SDR family NAD(P)-dependent oxidoreductase [Halosaccharopolyspora lacisalsi]MBA8824566.1 NAD(P)-dependent dehydrogenase (short-subunit alcohol dehydrogenase family) [Halosaccharopolyspora lacisalsi]
MRPLSEQTVLVTGATDGLGRALAERVAAQGARVAVHGRDPERTERTRGEITETTGNDRVEVVLADLSEPRNVCEMAQHVRERFRRVDVLVNNAGVGFGADETERQETADGIELRFAVNYLAGYVLTRELVPLLAASAPARVVNVASAGQQPIDFDNPMLTSGYSGTRAYAQSKLAQIMLTFDLAEQLRGEGVTVNALHPATYMNTTMVRQADIRPASTVDEGLEATYRLVAETSLEEVTGRYFHGLEEARALAQAYDPQERTRLRELSDKLVEHALAD